MKSPAGLLLQLLGKQCSLSTWVAKLVKNKLEEILLNIKSTQNKAEKRDGEKNIPEDNVGAFQSGCGQRLIPGLFNYMNQ